MDRKRITIASVIFVVIFSSVATAAGVQGPAINSDIPDQLTLPATMVGDKGRYVGYHVAGDDAHGPYPYLEFEIRPHEHIPDRTGKIHRSQVVWQAQSGWIEVFSENDHWEFDMASAELLHSDVETAGLIRAQSETLGRFDETQSGSVGVNEYQIPVAGGDLNVDVIFTWFSDGSRPNRAENCLISPLLAGSTVSTYDALKIFGDCTLLDLAVEDVTQFDSASQTNAENFPPSQDQVISSPPKFRPVGTTEDGLLVLEQVGLAAINRPLKIWIDENTPYPVQMAWQDFEADSWDVIILETFTPGTGGSETNAVHNDLELNPRSRIAERYGLPEDGIAHEFPPSIAFEAAKEDEIMGGWISNNPEAILVALDSHHRTENNEREFLDWSFRLQDSEGGAWIRVTKEITDVGNTSGTVDVTGAATDSVTVDGQIHDEGLPGNWKNLVVPPLPFASDVLMINEAFDGENNRPAGWAITLRCENNDKPTECQALQWDVGVGQFISRTGQGLTNENPAAIQSSIYSDRLFLGRDDHLPVLRMVVGIDIELGASSTPLEDGETHALNAGEGISWDIPPASVVAGTGLLAAIVASFYFFWPSIRLLGIPLFSRVQTADALAQPTRQKLYELISAEPGIHFKELVRKSETGASSVEHHLRKLIQTRLIVRRTASGYACYFLRGAPRRVIDAAPLLRHPTAREILAVINGHSALSGSTIALKIGINRGTVSHHVNRMIEGGLISARRDGRSVKYELTELGRAMALSGSAA